MRVRCYLGLDIGTTSISLTVLDIANGKTLSCKTKKNNARILNGEEDSYLLDPETILSLAQNLVDSALSRHPGIEGIGVTGQMHGVLIINRGGRALGPVYTWLDMSAARPSPSGQSYISELAELTGVSIPPGYGGATLYNLSRIDAIPSGAATFCTITDYVAMHLAGRSSPMLDPSLAHSLGFFDIRNNAFQQDFWRIITSLSLPDVVESATVIGRYKNSIPVTAGLGDNQASFLGSVGKSNSGILVNIGTSGQICFLESFDESLTDSNLEVRPFPTGEALMVGASLVGGKSFDVLAGFIEDLLNRFDLQADPYNLFDTFVTPPPNQNNRLNAKTTFKGTRLTPSETGSIRGISLDNFTIEHLYWAFARGIVEELYEMIGSHHAILENPNLYVVVCGNAIRKNISLEMEIKRRFGAPVKIPIQEESAAHGAALIAAAGTQGGLSVLPELADRFLDYK